jgi:hypothetical protein
MTITFLLLKRHYTSLVKNKKINKKKRKEKIKRKEN